MDRLSIDGIEVGAYTIPTDTHEADGTLAWDSTTLVVVHLTVGHVRALGYTYADAAAAHLIAGKLAGLIDGCDPMRVAAAHRNMVAAVRNLGRPGLAAAAISAVDTALWDLKARLLDLPLSVLLGEVHDSVAAYGSGGFTTYDDRQLTGQLAGWVEQGIRDVKMKVGAFPEDDERRVRIARDAVGPEAGLYVDANGAYTVKQALAFAEAFAGQGVTWFEEPVSSDDLAGLRLIRDRGPAGMEVAAGEYGYDPVYFRRMLEAGAVDVLQADATRCGGVTGFMTADALAEAHGRPLSAHTAPSLHAHLCCAARRARNVEYFHDHARIEGMLFDGAIAPVQGRLEPDRSAPGLGLTFKRRDAERYAVS